MKKALPLIMLALFCVSCAAPTAAPVLAPTGVTQPGPTQPPAAQTLTPAASPTPTTALPTPSPVPTVLPLPPVISAENAPQVVLLGSTAAPSLRRVVFSPDGSLFATASGNDADFGVRLWQIPGGEPLQAFNGYTGIVWDLAFSSDGQWLASAADDQNGQRLRIWNMSVRSQHAALEGPPTSSSVAFSPDGTRLAVGGLTAWPDGVIWIYDTSTWKVVQELKVPGQNVTALVYTPDGSLLLSGGTDGRIRVWSVLTGMEAKAITSGKQANRLALTPDGRLLASNFCAASSSSGCTQGGAAVWSTEDWTLLHKFDDLAESLAFSPDGTLLVVGSGQNDPHLRIRRVSDWQVVQTLPGEAYSTAFSPGGRLLASTGWTAVSQWGLPAEPAAAVPLETGPVLKTTLGEFEIAAARLVDEVHGQKAQTGEKYLLVILVGPGGKKLVPGAFSLEDFQKMVQDSSGGITVTSKEGTQRITTMAGWVDDEFAFGFMVPVSGTYTLIWPGNDPLELRPSGS